MVLPILNFLYSRILKILQKIKTLDIKNYRKDTSWNQCKSSKNVSLRYSSSFRRNIEIPFTKRELESELNWVENYIIAELNRDITDADDDNVTKNPTTRILLQILNGNGLYLPIAKFSKNVGKHSTHQLKSWFNFITTSVCKRWSQ